MKSVGNDRHHVFFREVHSVPTRERARNVLQVSVLGARLWQTYMCQSHLAVHPWTLEFCHLEAGSVPDPTKGKAHFGNRTLSYLAL